MQYQVVAKVADFLPNEVLVTVSQYFANCDFNGLKRYGDVIKSSKGVYAFISKDGNLYYLTETRCPFESTDVVYVMDCHN